MRVLGPKISPSTGALFTAPVVVFLLIVSVRSIRLLIFALIFLAGISNEVVSTVVCAA
jgi:hypothetical protein